MTQEQRKALQHRANIVRYELQQEVGASTMELVEELVELEIQLEAESNK